MIKEAHFHKRNLPHIYFNGATYFITYRLKNSLSPKLIKKLKEKIEQENKVLNKEDKYSRDQLFFEKYDELLNQRNEQSDILTKEDVAQIIKDSILYNNKKEYDLHTFCIMPNHVHLLITTFERSKSLDKIMGSIKGFSAREINLLSNKTGSLWQSESYDHVVRDEDEFYKVVNYILENPVKAKLINTWSDWKYTFISEDLRELL